MTKKEKYWYLNLEVTVGEYEFHCKSLHRGNFNAKDYTRNFYGDEVDEENETYYFNGGEVAVKIYDCKEIPESDYEILSQYL